MFLRGGGEGAAHGAAVPEGQGPAGRWAALAQIGVRGGGLQGVFSTHRSHCVGVPGARRSQAAHRRRRPHARRRRAALGRRKTVSAPARAGRKPAAPAFRSRDEEVRGDHRGSARDRLVPARRVRHAAERRIYRVLRPRDQRAPVAARKGGRRRERRVRRPAARPRLEGRAGSSRRRRIASSRSPSACTTSRSSNRSSRTRRRIWRRCRTS